MSARQIQLFFPVVLMLLHFQMDAQQKTSLSFGADMAYNLSPIKELDYTNWYVSGWCGNFTPAMTVRYGDMLSGMFRASYIRNKFQNQTFTHANGGTGSTYYTTDLHQIYVDFLLQYTIPGMVRPYFQAGPAAGIPIRSKIHTDRYFSGYEDWETHDEEFIHDLYFADLQWIIGYGIYIPLSERHLLRVENNIRIGMLKIPVQVNDSDYGDKVRTIDFQFIIGYIFDCKK